MWQLRVGPPVGEARVRGGGSGSIQGHAPRRPRRVEGGRTERGSRRSGYADPPPEPRIRRPALPRDGLPVGDIPIARPKDTRRLPPPSGGRGSAGPGPDQLGRAAPPPTDPPARWRARHRGG